MKLLRVFAISVFLLAICLLSAPSATAGELDRRTVVTFSAPVEVPGVGAQVLPAGTYVFTIIDMGSFRHIVRISSEDGSHIFTTAMTVPNFRMKRTGETVITFKEQPAGQPEAIRAWFYPGRYWGEEFVYPKARAVALAKVVNEPVLATPIELAAAPVEALKTAPVLAVKPTGEEVEMAQVVEPPPALPHTASPLPLVGLLGMLSLGAGFVLSLIQKRFA